MSDLQNAKLETSKYWWEQNSQDREIINFEQSELRLKTSYLILVFTLNSTSDFLEILSKGIVHLIKLNRENIQTLNHINKNLPCQLAVMQWRNFLPLDVSKQPIVVFVFLLHLEL